MTTKPVWDFEKVRARIVSAAVLSQIRDRIQKHCRIFTCIAQHHVARDTQQPTNPSVFVVVINNKPTPIGRTLTNGARIVLLCTQHFICPRLQSISFTPPSNTLIVQAFVTHSHVCSRKSSGMEPAETLLNIGLLPSLCAVKTLLTNCVTFCRLAPWVRMTTALAFSFLLQSFLAIYAKLTLRLTWDLWTVAMAAAHPSSKSFTTPSYLTFRFTF